MRSEGQLQQESVIGGTAGNLDAGLYTPENVTVRRGASATHLTLVAASR